MERGLQLFVDQLVGFAKVLAALGVSENHVRGADGLQHQRRGLAGESPLVGVIHVLRAYGDAGAGDRRDKHGNRRE